MSLTQAEIAGFRACPNCGIRRLKTTGTRETGTHDQCLSCGYLMIWKPQPKWSDEDRANARRVQENYIRAKVS